MKATVDQEMCVGCGICPEVCPEVFEMTDENKAHAKVETVPKEAEANCRDAAGQCPVAAIILS